MNLESQLKSDMKIKIGLDCILLMYVFQSDFLKTLYSVLKVSSLLSMCY